MKIKIIGKVFFEEFSSNLGLCPRKKLQDIVAKVASFVFLGHGSLTAPL